MQGFVLVFAKLNLVGMFSPSVGLILDEGVTGNIFKFADDTYLFRNMEIGDKQKLHDDIDKLVSWSENG